MRVLLLAGTSEAREIAAQAALLPRVEVIASLAGATRAPMTVAARQRVGGFGGAEGLAAFLRAEAIDAVIDATHPFAARISANAAQAGAMTRVPVLHVLRPPWQPEEGDIWYDVEAEEDVAGLIPPGRTVFLATGRQSLPRFANLAGRTVIARQIDPPQSPFPFPGGRYELGRPPFSVADEVGLFRRLGVDWLVVKNAGGTASRSKLDAARELGLPVAMLRRPAPPQGELAQDVAAALRWIRARLGAAAA